MCELPVRGRVYLRWGTYRGGIATGWEAGIEGLDIAEEFKDLCTGCSRYVNACPLKIDIPWINTVVRDHINRGKDPGFDDLLVDGSSPTRRRAERLSVSASSGASKPL